MYVCMYINSVQKVLYQNLFYSSNKQDFINQIDVLITIKDILFLSFSFLFNFIPFDRKAMTRILSKKCVSAKMDRIRIKLEQAPLCL